MAYFNQNLLRLCRISERKTRPNPSTTAWGALQSVCVIIRLNRNEFRRSNKFEQIKLRLIELRLPSNKDRHSVNMREQCTLCPSKIPASRMGSHFATKHNDNSKSFEAAKQDVKEDDSNISKECNEEDIIGCRYCSTKFPKLKLRAHIEKEHSWCDDLDVPYEISENKHESFDNQDASTIVKDLSTCELCQQIVEKSNLDEHLLLKHDINRRNEEIEKKHRMNNFSLDEEENQGEIVIGEICEMCEDRIPAHNMIAHLLKEHEIRVVNDNDDSEFNGAFNKSVMSNDPFDVPDFLRSKERPKYKCHHCQKNFTTQMKVEKHTNKKHGSRCKVCTTHKLVLEQRTDGIMKQLRTSKGFKEETIARSDYMGKTQQQQDYVPQYEDFFPAAKNVQCIICEDEFHWADQDHECSFTAARRRIVAGVEFQAEPPSHRNDVVDDIWMAPIPKSLAESIVKREAEQAVFSYMREIVDGFVISALETETEIEIQKYNQEDLNTRLRSQILAYRFLARGESPPKAVVRGASHQGLYDCSLNETRRLSFFFFNEYKDELKEIDKQNFEKKTSEENLLREATLKNINRSKIYYDYSKTIMLPKQKKTKQIEEGWSWLKNIKSQSQQQTTESILNTSGTSGTTIQLPSGNLLNMNGKTYIRNLKKKQQQPIVPSSQGRGLPDKTNDCSLSKIQNSFHGKLKENDFNRPLPTVMKHSDLTKNSLPTPTVLKHSDQTKTSLGTMQLTGIKSSAPNHLKKIPSTIAIARVPPVTPATSSFPPPQLQRLQSLGLHVTKSSNNTDSKLAPKQDGPKASEIRRPNTTVVTPRPVEPQRAPPPPAPRVAARQHPGPARQNPGPVRQDPGPAAPQRRLQPAVQPARAVVAPTKQKLNSQQAAVRLARSQPAATFTDGQKLQLKSQLLSYRMLIRGEMVDQVILRAATLTNIRNDIDKNDMKKLSNFFRQEYNK